nr:hypothetical protein [Tanacetum cinerariifolium]
MVAILEKGEFNTDFHPMVDFIAASPLRIETTDEGTHILATVDGIQRTVSEASFRRNIKLRDEDGIVSISNTELFENFTLMGYNISQNQKFTFQKGQFSHQWKYLIHTIMQCLSPKSTGFNKFNSNIATALVCLATNGTYNFSKMIFDGMVKNVNNKVSKFLIYPRMARLQFCDYHNMVAILEKGEFNTDFHPMVDFIAASPLRYALTIKPTVFVSHIRQFWSTARIETTDEGTHILATVDGIQRTVSEASLRRNLKLRDEDGIVSIPDTELFENLTLMGYNISQNQKFTFQKGQFSHQWKYLIHTIMQCLSPKSTGFNEFSSNIATALVCLATNRTYNFSKMIFDGLVKNVNNKVSKFLMYPRFLTKCLRMSQFVQNSHTHQYVVPFHTTKLFTTLRVNSPSFSGRIVPLFDTMLVHQGEGSDTPTEPHHTPSPEATSSHHTTSSIPLPSIPTAPIPTVTHTDTTPIIQYSRRARIAQSSAFSTVADEPASPGGDDSQGEACPTDSGFIADQDRATIAKSSTLPHDSAPRVTSPAAEEGTQEVEINRLKERVKYLEDKEGVIGDKYGDDAPIKGRTSNEGEAAAEKISTDSEEIARVLTSLDTANVLAGETNVATGSGFIPTVDPPTTIVSTGSELEMLHAEEEIQGMIDSLDKSNETVAKYLQEYQ